MTVTTLAPRHIAPAIIVAVGLLAACELPTEPSKGFDSKARATPTATPKPTPTFTPTPTPLPSPTPQPILVQFLGAVTDQDGTPLVGVIVYVAYIDNNNRWQSQQLKTIEGGRYSVHVPAKPTSDLTGVPNTLGIVSAYVGNYDWMTQAVVDGGSENEVDLRLRTIPLVDAGSSTTLVLDASSSLYIDWDSINGAWRAEGFYVKSATDGVLTIEAASAGGVVPLVQFGDDFAGAKAGTLTRPIKAGVTTYFRLRVPTGTAPQQFTVQTSMQANAK